MAVVAVDDGSGAAGTYALLTDGTTVGIRPARPDDFEAVRDMHARMSTENLYMRFFGVSRAAAEQEARRICREPRRTGPRCWRSWTATSSAAAATS